MCIRIFLRTARAQYQLLKERMDDFVDDIWIKAKNTFQTLVGERMYGEILYLNLVQVISGKNLNE